MKINVGVFFGGKSTEHEISIISAVQAMTNMSKDKYNVVPIYFTKQGEFYTGAPLLDIDNYKSIDTLLGTCTKINITSNDGKTFLFAVKTKVFGKDKPISQIDVALPIVHGTNVEDGALQGFLKTLNIPFVGPDVLPAAIAMDKHVFRVMLKDGGFPVLDCVTVTNIEFEKDKEIGDKKIADKFKYPVIVKPVNLGSSIGINKADNKTELVEAIEVALSFSKKVVIEQMITNLKEINASVLGDYENATVSALEQPIMNDEILSYEDKYKNEGKTANKTNESMKRILPAPLEKDEEETIKDLAIRVFKYLDVSGVTRIDFLIDQDNSKIYINELNTIPGSLSYYLWQPIAVMYPELIDKLIELAFKRERDNKKINFSFETNILENAPKGK